MNETYSIFLHTDRELKPEERAHFVQSHQPEPYDDWEPPEIYFLENDNILILLGTDEEAAINQEYGIWINEAWRTTGTVTVFHSIYDQTINESW